MGILSKKRSQDPTKKIVIIGAIPASYTEGLLRPLATQLTCVEAAPLAAINEKSCK